MGKQAFCTFGEYPTTRVETVLLITITGGSTLAENESLMPFSEGRKLKPGLPHSGTAAIILSKMEMTPWVPEFWF